MKPFLILILLLLAGNGLYAQLDVSVSTDKKVYPDGDTVYVTVKATNHGSIADTLFFASCLQADYLVDSLDWAAGLYWCQHTNSVILPPHGSTFWGREYFQGYPYPHSGLSPLGVGKHAVIGTLARYGTSDTLWIVVTPLTDISDPAIIPREYALENNYPNPFNPSTTIRYRLPLRSLITLSVFNILGQTVSTLVNGIEEAGYHAVIFDGSGLSSGMYFYRMQAGSFAKTKELLLLR